MGATHVTVTIRNPAAPDRAWEGLFLVDTGATDCLVPRPHLDHRSQAERPASQWGRTQTRRHDRGHRIYGRNRRRR